MKLNKNEKVHQTPLNWKWTQPVDKDGWVHRSQNVESDLGSTLFASNTGISVKLRNLKKNEPHLIRSRLVRSVGIESPLGVNRLTEEQIRRVFADN